MQDLRNAWECNDRLHVFYYCDRAFTVAFYPRYMNSDTSRLPSFATCSAEEAAKYAEDTQQGYWSLLSYELFWRDRFVFLKEHGYQLRPRFEPNWTPSWLGKNYDPFFCEDSILSMV